MPEASTVLTPIASVAIIRTNPVCASCGARATWRETERTVEMAHVNDWCVVHLPLTVDNIIET